MTSKATSNYDRIYALGAALAEQLPARRPSDMLDWPRMLQVWQALEQRLKALHGYEVISAAWADVDVKLLLRQLRERLHYIGASLSAGMYLAITSTDLLLKHALLVAREDQVTLISKGEHYGDSWKRRGGVGAFMMLCRKWDRIENLLDSNATGPDLLTLLQRNPGDVQDDIADLRRYLLLVEDEVIERIEQRRAP